MTFPTSTVSTSVDQWLHQSVMKLKELTQRAYDLNQKKLSGREVFIVYQDEIVKVSPNLSALKKKTYEPVRVCGDQLRLLEC